MNTATRMANQCRVILIDFFHYHRPCSCSSRIDERNHCIAVRSALDKLLKINNSIVLTNEWNHNHYSISSVPLQWMNAWIRLRIARASQMQMIIHRSFSLLDSNFEFFVRKIRRQPTMDAQKEKLNSNPPNKCYSQFNIKKIREEFKTWKAG